MDKLNKIESVVNIFLSSNLDKVKEQFSRHSTKVMSHDEYKKLITRISVTITEDKHYKPNTPINGGSLNCDEETDYIYSGFGNLTVNCFWDLDIEDYDEMSEHISYSDENPDVLTDFFMYDTLSKSVFKYLSVDMWRAFLNIRIEHYNKNNKLFHYEHSVDYDTYDFDGVCGVHLDPRLSKYWSKVDTTN